MGTVNEPEMSLAVLSEASVMIAESPGVFSETVDALGVANGFSGFADTDTAVSFSKSSMGTPSSDDGTM